MTSTSRTRKSTNYVKITSMKKCCIANLYTNKNTTWLAKVLDLICVHKETKSTHKHINKAKKHKQNTHNTKGHSKVARDGIHGDSCERRGKSPLILVNYASMLKHAYMQANLVHVLNVSINTPTFAVYAHYYHSKHSLCVCKHNFRNHEITDVVEQGSAARCT